MFTQTEMLTIILTLILVVLIFMIGYHWVMQSRWKAVQRQRDDAESHLRVYQLEHDDDD